MMRILLLVASVAACVTPDAGQRAVGELTPEQAFNLKWSGKHESDVLLQYGKPTDEILLQTGDRILSYHHEIPVSESRGGAFVGVYGGSAASRSESTIIYCDRRFEIDRDDRRVRRAVITGSRCDWSR